MKDLKHYFTDSLKASEASNESSEVTKEPASEENAKAASPSSARKKRGRVKIKISQTNARGAVCDIVDSKSDLVDKTPSPFAPRDLKADEVADGDTPKRSTSLPRKSAKISLRKVANKRASVQSGSEDKSPEKNGNKLSPTEPEVGEAASVKGEAASANGEAALAKSEAASAKSDAASAKDEAASTKAGATSAKDKENSAELGSSSEIPASEREESNAFRVLMAPKKLVQYNAAASLTPQEEEAAAKAAEEQRNKLKQNREKLTALADKKGYSKRKLEEIEEAERIERRLEKRAKVFRQMDKREGEEKNTGRRVSPGSLHNYFSKATPVQKEKELTDVSTLVVQAEVHTPDLVSPAKVIERRESQAMMKEAEKSDEKVLVIVNDVQIVEAETLPLSEISPEKTQTNQRRNKPRWSLRINLPSKKEIVEADAPIANGDKATPGKRESKHRKSKAKAANYEENGDSDLEVTNVKGSKKRKAAASSQKNKSVAAADSQNEGLVIEPVISSVEKTEASTSPSPEIIEVKVDKQLTSGKLAPLFMKRHKPDPAVLEARRLFLHSFPAENENSRTERRVPIVGTPRLPFPTISHVAQLDTETKIETAQSKTKFPARENNLYAPSFKLDEFKSVTSLKNDSARNNKDPVEMARENVEEVLTEIESRCPGAREIWKRVSTTAHGEETPRVSPRRKGKKRKSNEKKTEVSDEKTGDACTWTQKYRPLSTGEIVGNEDAAEKLRKWLDGWKAPPRKDDNSSGDEFYSSDCSFASNFDNNQVAVLLGPHGSGKTASVYAVAEELGYSILEINASSKRAGKKILKELEEATKSHRIKKSDALPLASLMKQRKAIPKNSLILVEDVDLIFEEDEGFISATCQLASNTKRPIVMTGRDTCSHLSRMAPQQHRIYYQTTAGSRVSALLELITLAESGYRLPRPCLDRLLQNGDLRKALLQLQFLLLSGKPKASEVPTNFQQSLWRDMRHCVYKPAVKATKKPSKKKLADGKKIVPPREENVVAGLAKDLDSLSFLSTLTEIEDPALEFSSLKLEPSISLDESEHAYSSTNGTSAEIAGWLRDRVMGEKEASDSSGSSLRQLSLKKELSLGVNFALSQVSPNILDNKVFALDYLPSLRAMCRAEEVRVTNNSKRGNRFYHYLQSLRLPTSSTRPNILAAACKIMREKINSES